MSAPKAHSKPRVLQGQKRKASHPPYLEMIRRCIIEMDDKGGVSRPTIKKYVASRWGLDPEQTTTKNSIANAIQLGQRHKTLVLPKGAAGKVKLSAEAKKEHTQPEQKKLAARKGHQKKVQAVRAKGVKPGKTAPGDTKMPAKKKQKKKDATGDKARDENQKEKRGEVRAADESSGESGGTLSEVETETDEEAPKVRKAPKAIMTETKKTTASKVPKAAPKKASSPTTAAAKKKPGNVPAARTKLQGPSTYSKVQKR